MHFLNDLNKFGFSKKINFFSENDIYNLQNIPLKILSEGKYISDQNLPSDRINEKVNYYNNEYNVKTFLELLAEIF